MRKNIPPSRESCPRDDIVIADGLNYIKGFRYQLYCEAKALQTPSCVVSIPCALMGCTTDSPRAAHRHARRTMSLRTTRSSWRIKMPTAVMRRMTLRTSSSGMRSPMA